MFCGRTSCASRQSSSVAIGHCQLTGEGCRHSSVISVTINIKLICSVFFAPHFRSPIPIGLRQSSEQSAVVFLAYFPDFAAYVYQLSGFDKNVCHLSPVLFKFRILSLCKLNREILIPFYAIFQASEIETLIKTLSVLFMHSLPILQTSYGRCHLAVCMYVCA